MPKIKVPEGGSGCSFDGVEYHADAEGLVDVPLAAVAVLMDFGFTIPQEPVPELLEPAPAVSVPDLVLENNGDTASTQDEAPGAGQENRDD